MKTEITEQHLRIHVRRIHYLMQWLVIIALVQLAVVAWLTYKVVGN
jgi:hypothetical protein